MGPKLSYHRGVLEQIVHLISQRIKEQVFNSESKGFIRSFKLNLSEEKYTPRRIIRLSFP